MSSLVLLIKFEAYYSYCSSVLDVYKGLLIHFAASKANGLRRQTAVCSWRVYVRRAYSNILNAEFRPTAHCSTLKLLRYHESFILLAYLPVSMWASRMIYCWQNLIYLIWQVCGCCRKH